MTTCLSIVVGRDAMPHTVEEILDSLDIEHTDGAFSVGDPDPSRLVTGFEVAAFDQPEVVAMAARLGPLAGNMIVVGAMGNSDLDHRRLALVGSEIAGRVKGLVVLRVHASPPKAAAAAGWAHCLARIPLGVRTIYEYAVEPAVLRAWSDLSPFEMVK